MNISIPRLPSRGPSLQYHERVVRAALCELRAGWASKFVGSLEIR
jgi:hypothetical protein